jgi:hypothetical protein
MMWLVTTVFVILAVLAFLGRRWAYFTFVALGVLFFPARVGFHFHPSPCEFSLNLPLAVYSLTNYGHLVRFAIFFLMTCVQVRDHPLRTQILIGFAAVLAFGICVEVAEGVTGEGHCRLRDLIPDLAGGVIGTILWVGWRVGRGLTIPL